jgi:tRNA dimethylallyltransferase
MVAAGFADEVAALRTRAGDDAPAWASVGYREMRAYVDGTSTLDDALAATVLATRRFAKRQRTWFRAEATILWRHPVTDHARMVAEARAFVVRGERPAA